MHVLITGGAGFIGTHLALRLCKQGHRVTVLDNNPKEGPMLGVIPRLQRVVGSVLDAHFVSELASSCDTIIHLAAVVGVRRAMDRGRETLAVSYRGTENVLEAALQHGKELFVASSSAIYGKISEIPAREEADVLLGASHKTSWLYSIGKLVEEHLSLAYYREAGVAVKIGRFFNVIGPLQNNGYGMVVPTFITQALAGSPLSVYGDGSQTRTFVYIEDALDGLEQILTQGTHGTVYNIGGRQEISMLELAEKIKELTASRSPIEFLPFRNVFGEHFEETARRVPDITRLRNLGYSPRYSLEQGLNEIIDYYRKNARKR